MYREFCERTADENAIRPMKIGRRMWKDEIACVGVSVGSTDPKRKICALDCAVPRRGPRRWPPIGIGTNLSASGSIDRSAPYVSFGSTRWGVVETGAPLSSSHKIFALFYGVPTEAVGSLPADQGRNSGVEDDGIACGGSARLSPPRQAAEMRPLTRVVVRPDACADLMRLLPFVDTDASQFNAMLFHGYCCMPQRSIESSNYARWEGFCRLDLPGSPSCFATVARCRIRAQPLCMGSSTIA
ncbi:hypothetical protein BHE74_00019441 [Ensete ventricosum]|nr:hypothetical protein BHE74_00019441 [Ensete ventricosum]